MTTRTETPNILDTVLTLSGATPAPPESARPLLALAAITNDGGTQMRAGMDAATVTEYEEAIRQADGAWPFPAVVVYHDGDKYWLADGFHRINAAHRVGLVSVPTDVRAGTRRDAILHAAGANASHGLRRTNDDKRRAVDALLRDEEWSKWSDGAIAKACGVSQPFVSAMRRGMTQNGFESPARTGADGRVYNTQNIGSNRPASLSDGELTLIVQTWMKGFWRQPWPENPSHTNGTLWQELTAWMHENVSQPWKESDLKEAIKRLHYQAMAATPAPAAVAPRPSPFAPAAPSRTEIYEIESVVRRVASEERATASDLRTIARQRIGRVWLECRKALPADVAYRDLAQAINNVASQMEQRPAAQADSDLHAGAGQTPPPPLTVAELVEDLDGYLTGIPAAEIDAAAKGAQNRALTTAQQCLSDFTYRQEDLYRALQRLALQRGAAQPAEPVVNGERPLPEWAAPEPATVAQTVLARHPQHDDLFEFSELFKLAIKETHRWAHITGEHTAAILDGFTGQP